MIKDEQITWDELLKGVSRSFYLSLAILPMEIRQPIGLAYLLARAADTLADRDVLPASQRLQALHTLQQHLYQPIAGDGLQKIQASLGEHQAHSAETTLLQKLPDLFKLLHQLPANDQQRVRLVLTTLTSGMIYDLATFSNQENACQENSQITVLPDQVALEHYTYMVAGCVGEFWTDMSIAHLPELAHWSRQLFVERGIQFGKGLQLINILRDLPRDLRIGRCYLPQSWLAQHQLSVLQLLNAKNSQTAKPLLLHGVQLAHQYLQAAEQYILAIPRTSPRLRLASLWPLLIGLATLQQLSSDSEHWLDEQHVCKISRAWIYQMLIVSVLCVMSNSLLRYWIKRLVGKVGL